jgi:hypothetical protein
MLFANCIDASALKPFDLFPVSCFKGCKHGDVAGLELVGSMRRETTQDNVARKAELQDFQSFMRAEAIAHKHAWLVVSSFLRLRIKHTCEPLQADVRVGVPSLGAGILPAGGGKGGPVTSVRWLVR